ncbi:hypothetical protein MSPP1_000855 [Malassezia sp. CBS 17886]|nr:hypothetical protein MSPP1_000855 [Malassezia sp. CBS 17886]
MQGDPDGSHVPDGGRVVTVEYAEARSDCASTNSSARRAEELGVSTQYERQVALVNQAIMEEIGFGAFQIKLTILAGFGWLADNIWFEALAVTLPQIGYEFDVAHVQFATFSLYLGLLVGSTFWGFFSDIIGRRPSWNATLFISGAFGIGVGAAPNFVGMCCMLACLGFGLGGNLPVDGAMMIEFIPGPYQWVLTLLSLFWCIGQLFAALITWAFITNYRCTSADNCPRSSNEGWRYSWFLLGGCVLLMWVLRYFVYPIPESPKYLLAMRREEDAFRVLQFVAKENGRATTLTLEKLRQAGLGRTMQVAGDEEAAPAASMDTNAKAGPPDGKAEATVEVHTRSYAWSQTQLGGHALSPRRVRENLRALHRSPMGALFASRRMALNTVLVCACWGAIGLAYPLFNSFIAIYLGKIGVDAGTSTQTEEYRQLVIIAACGIPGSLIATAMVEVPYAGRRGSMAAFTGLTGVFLFLFTTARNPSAVLGWNCAISLTQNAMYGILYAITYEVFPAPQRGTGDGLAMSTQRVFGVVATLIAVYASENVVVPIYVSASIFLFAMVIMLFLPYEPRGQNAL